jgi:hypothetical protein
MNNVVEKQNGSTASKTSALLPIVLTYSIIPFRNTTVLSVPSDNSGHGSIVTRKPSLQASRNGGRHSKTSGLVAYGEDLSA